MVAGYGQGVDLGAVHEAHEAEFGAVQEFLYHHAAFAELVVEQHVAQSGLGFGVVLGHDDAFAGGQSVIFDDDLFGTGQHVVERGPELLERARSCRGDVVAGHQFLGERLAGLDLRGGPGGAEDAQAPFAELVDNAVSQRHFGAYYGQRYGGVGGEAGQVVDVGHRDLNGRGLHVDAGVAGSAIYAAHRFGALQRIHNGVLAASRADH